MAVIKVFDSVGVKTLVLVGNAMEQPYDAPDDESCEPQGEPEEED